jgi:hypothetical protein
MKRIMAKLGKMRRAAEFCVYPAQKDGRITIQSDKRIAVFRNDGNNRGMLSKHCSDGAYFIHLSPMCGATEVDIPQEVIDAAIDAMPQSGDVICGVVTIA